MTRRLRISSKKGFLKSWKIEDLGKVSERSSKKRLKVLFKTIFFNYLEIIFTITLSCGKSKEYHSITGNKTEKNCGKGL